LQDLPMFQKKRLKWIFIEFKMWRN
jgi:hypothetical protein